jgi:hypothetical protein
MDQLVLDLFPDVEKPEQDYSSTFADNMKLPIHRWYRYTAGFSALWVKKLIHSEKARREVRVIDPFAGSGTVLLESELEHVPSYGIEAHPYIYRIARTKLNWRYPIDAFKREMLLFLKAAELTDVASREYPELVRKCYSETALRKLEALRQTWMCREMEPEIRNFAWFIITSILRITSSVGTAQWQYILPNKSKSKVLDPFLAFEAKTYEMYEDMRHVQRYEKTATPSIICNEDSRDIKGIPEGWGNMVITSPPYANNYDYADATRLEMTFWGDISGWSDLQDTVRTHLVRACTQHVSNLKDGIDNILYSQELLAIQPDLLDVYSRLEKERLEHGGKKNYHLMIAAYFYDLSRVFRSLRVVTGADCKMCFVIGDSAPYGIYVPVDKWLGELAVSAGFDSYSFEKLRDRNMKWKNRKHTVPLKEGRLWINS